MFLTTSASIVVGGVVAIATGGLGVPAMIQSGIAAGAAGGFTGGAVGTALAGGSFEDAMDAGLQGAMVGAMMGGITASIGAQFGGLGSVWNELGRASVHSLAQGGFSVMRGGDFWQGAAAGFVSSLAGSGAQRIGIHGWGMVGVSAFSGGAGAAIAGGKTEDILFGVVCGAMVGVLNHLANEISLERALENAGFKGNHTANWTNEEIATNMAKIFPDLYEAANRPKFELKDYIPTKSGVSAMGQAQKEIVPLANGKFTVRSLGLIYLNRGLTSSIREMASYAGHELNHVADYVSGAYAGWANKFNDTKIANWYSERNAYGWEISVDSPFKNQAQYDYYNNLINALK